ncbi:MAG TPA: hypothetical protein VLT33_46640 [Labilithrix sp.]|nr:hypothetical protein [Labilithrix sp.]
MPTVKSTLVLTAAVALGASLAATAACGSSDPPSEFVEPDAGDVDPDGSSVIGDTAPPVHDDFKDPVFAEGATPSAAQVFAQPDVSGGDGGAGGPCLYAPQIGTLFPGNWLRPRFQFVAGAAENLFQIKLVVPNQISPLVIYTTKSGYILDKHLWEILTRTGYGTVHLTVRSATVDGAGKVTAGPFKGTEGDFEVAPPAVRATGSVLYWTTSGGTVLKGFKVGDETVQSVVTPGSVQTQCVACHTSTPDGLYAGMTASSSATDGTPSSISIRSVDGLLKEPPFLTAPAKTLLARLQYAPTFSKAHWQAGDHTMLTMFTVAARTEIAWTDLEAKSDVQGVGWNVLARTGDTGAASSAVFSHDGTKVGYVSVTASGAGVIATDGRIHIVPYANRAGGVSTAVPGASDAAFNQFYPTFSADDQLLAFNRVSATGNSTSYNNPAAEVFVVPTTGGTPTRLAAKKSPGITNSWPKWSPEVQDDAGKSYYFLVFSSTRNPGSAGPQLYVAPIVVAGGVVKTYAALDLWNQPENENNHTPAWDVFQLPGPK